MSEHGPLFDGNAFPATLGERIAVCRPFRAGLSSMSTS
jgi:hypothetical protein